jgi:hypothetical protein
MFADDHGNLLFADVTMAVAVLPKNFGCREARYICNFGGGTPTHAVHGMADVRSAPTTAALRILADM